MQTVATLQGELFKTERRLIDAEDCLNDNQEYLRQACKEKDELKERNLKEKTLLQGSLNKRQIEQKNEKAKSDAIQKELREKLDQAQINCGWFMKQN